ncbi:ATP-binding protein [Lactococcus formosensis subsp. bovis]|uniref:ATP-binding protein n=1 Tax=Lactococcus formosensis TaxID=1281486 RepID=UPI001BD110CB|nr:ATP-binding protein [Lactococcus formosensis]
MESIGEVISKKPSFKKVRENYSKLVESILNNQEIKSFISENKMTEAEVSLSHSKFFEYLKAKEAYLLNPSATVTGLEPKLIMSQGFATVTYIQTQDDIDRMNRNKKNFMFERDSIILDKTILNASFDNYKAETEEEKRALKFAQGASAFYKRGGQGNTVFVGRAGAGKSHLAMSIIKSYNAEKDGIGLFITSSQIPTLVQDGFNNKHSKYSRHYFIDLFSNVDLLVLDDLGSEKASEFTVKLLKELLETRIRTIITTNYSSEELESIYNKFDPHGQLVSRIFRGIGEKVLNVNGIKDKRLRAF